MDSGRWPHSLVLRAKVQVLLAAGAGAENETFFATVSGLFYEGGLGLHGHLELNCALDQGSGREESNSVSPIQALAGVIFVHLSWGCQFPLTYFLLYCPYHPNPMFWSHCGLGSFLF